jgi:hypothetical protein
VSLESDFYKLIPGFTQYIAEKNLDFAIAAGNSASDFANRVEDSARLQLLTLPAIYRLSRAESKLMYFDDGFDPISVISGILTVAALGNTENVLKVHFLEDYSLYGAKSRCTDQCLSKKPYASSFSFIYHIMVAGREIRRPNVDVYHIDLALATGRDLKFNGN